MRSRLALLFAGLMSACAFSPPTTVPMPAEHGQAERQSDTLVVFLPGRFPREGDFRENGFFDRTREAGMDMIAADAHLGYYREQSVVDRLHEDIIEPAMAQGYKHIWLAGISMGGLGTGLYVEQHPGIIEGLILLAPYTGDQGIAEEIAAQGGLAAWNGEASAGRDFERQVWRQFQSLIVDRDPPRIVLGYGRDDRFAQSNRVLADALPEHQRFTVEGGHNWDAWRPLWNDILGNGLPTGP